MGVSHLFTIRVDTTQIRESRDWGGKGYGWRGEDGDKGNTERNTSEMWLVSFLCLYFLFPFFVSLRPIIFFFVFYISLEYGSRLVQMHFSID